MAALVGREGEQARAALFVEAVAAGPAGLTFTGAPGIGTTACWRAALAAARAAGHRVLVARPSPADHFLPASGLVDLFAGTAPPAPAAGDWSHLGPAELREAVGSALDALSAEGPVVIAVDDEPWLDEASDRALRVALRRLEDHHRVGVLTTRRDEPATGRPLLVEALGGTPDVRRLAGLRLDALRQVLAPHVEAVSPPRLRRIHALSGGNPLHALELARFAAAEPVAAGSAEQPLPPTLRAALARRLAEVPPEVHRLLLVLAVLGPAPVSAVSALLDGDDRGAWAAAEAGRIVAVGADMVARPTSPLLCTLVYQGAGWRERRELHARAARTATDQDARARHLAASTDVPSEEVAGVLESASRRALEVGATDLAAEHASQAVRLTAPGDPRGAERRLLLSTCLAATGEVRAARELLEVLVAQAPTAQERTRALLHRLAVAGDDHGTSVDLLEAALDEACGDPALTGRVHDLLGWVLGMFHGDLRRAERHVTEGERLLRLHGQESEARLAAAHLVHVRAARGRPDPPRMRDLARSRGSSPTDGGGPAAWLAKQVLWSGDVAAARRLVEAAVSDDARRGNELERPYRLYDLALVDCLAGDLDAAERTVDAALLAASDAGNEDAAWWLAFPAGLLAALRGDRRSAAAHAERLRGATGRTAGVSGRARAAWLLGLAHLGAGDTAAAAELLAEGAALLERWGVGHPGVVPLLPDAVEALAGLGRLEQAAELHRRLERQAARVGTAWARAQADRAQGTLALAAGQPDRAAGLLARAESGLAATGMVVERARAGHRRGHALVRAGRPAEARRSWSECRAAFATRGMHAWAARVEEDLERAPGSRVEATLTGTERQVARRAAAGLRNREIAGEMYLALTTVEAHLTRVYRKLGIRSRTELVRLEAAGALAEPAAVS